MAVLNRDELTARLKEMFGDQDDDKSLSFMEDLTDTIDNYESNSNSNRVHELETEVNELKEKYRQRFFTPKEEQVDEPEPEAEPPKKLTFESLFTQE